MRRPFKLQVPCRSDGNVVDSAPTSPSRHSTVPRPSLETPQPRTASAPSLQDLGHISGPDQRVTERSAEALADRIVTSLDEAGSSNGSAIAVVTEQAAAIGGEEEHRLPTAHPDEADGETLKGIHRLNMHARQGRPKLESFDRRFGRQPNVIKQVRVASVSFRCNLSAEKTPTVTSRIRNAGQAGRLYARVVGVCAAAVARIATGHHALARARAQAGCAGEQLPVRRSRADTILFATAAACAALGAARRGAAEPRATFRRQRARQAAADRTPSGSQCVRGKTLRFHTFCLRKRGSGASRFD